MSAAWLLIAFVPFVTANPDAIIGKQDLHAEMLAKPIFPVLMDTFKKQEDCIAAMGTTGDTPFACIPGRVPDKK